MEILINDDIHVNFISDNELVIWDTQGTDYDAVTTEIISRYPNAISINIPI